MYEPYLYKFHWFRLKDHILAKIDKLPDNRKDKQYYEELRVKRLESRPFNIFFRLDKEIAESQMGLCPICNIDLFNGEIINTHHIIPKAEGGKYTFQNLVLLHFRCHQQIHSEEYNLYYKKFLYEYRLNHPRINIQKKLGQKVASSA